MTMSKSVNETNMTHSVLLEKLNNALATLSNEQQHLLKAALLELYAEPGFDSQSHRDLLDSLADNWR